MISDQLIDYGVDKYDIGSGFGHFAIATEDVSIFYGGFFYYIYLGDIMFL